MMRSACHYHMESECKELLSGLKKIVEGLLVVNSSNVWSTVGGLSRLANQLHTVFQHGLKEEIQDYWDFVLCLRRLQPTWFPFLEKVNRLAQEQGVSTGKIWLQISLEQLTLRTQLEILVQKEDLSHYYGTSAFLCQAAYVEALLICLRAIEQNDVCLLTELDYSLFAVPRKSHQDLNSRSSRPQFMSLAFQSSMEHPQESFAPYFISPAKAESPPSLSHEYAFGVSPSMRQHSASNLLESVLQVANGGPARYESDLKDEAEDMKLSDGMSDESSVDPLMNQECSVRSQNSSSSGKVPSLATNDNENFSEIRPLNQEEKRNSSSRVYDYNLDDDEISNAIVRTAQSIEGDDVVKKQHERLQKSSAPDSVDNSSNCALLEVSVESTLEENDESKKSEKVFWWEASGDSDNGDIQEEVAKSFSKNGKLCFPEDLQESRSGDQTVKPEDVLIDVSSALENAVSIEAADDLKDSQESESTNSGAKSKFQRRISFNAETGLSESRTREKRLRRRNAHKRWHSEQISQKQASKILEEVRANEGQDQIDGAVFSSSLPDKAIHRRQHSGVQSPMMDGYFPQPVEGESLLSFLSSQDFATCPELDKENAHFCISEAIISAVEQIKCKQLNRKDPSDHESDGSDEEIQELKQRIRIRRKERRKGRYQPDDDFVINAAHLSPDSCSPLSHSSGQLSSELSESSENDLEDIELNESNLLNMQDGGLSASMASLYSDADIQRSPPSNNSLSQENILKPHIDTGHSLSAESIALTLIKKFSVKHLPAASELDWLVSEKDAPQALLPLPKSVPISPDDGENADLYMLPNKSTRLRGNLEWAPPRPQLIFNIHPPPKKKLIIAKQNYRCAGCGMKVDRGFLKRLRYCEYLGKLFCQCCHTSSVAHIPARILQKWDFTKYPVSNFALDFLNKIQNDPLFSLPDINPLLYKRIKPLQNCKELRTQLFSLKDFLRTCRLSASMLSMYNNQPQHLLTQQDTYSIQDLLNIRSGDLEKTLFNLVQSAVQHIAQCPLCQARGFICELCNKETDVIFPFELDKTYQCQECRSCFHRSCFEERPTCPKCVRIKRRKTLLAQASESSSSEDSAQNANSQPTSPTKGR